MRQTACILIAVLSLLVAPSGSCLDAPVFWLGGNVGYGTYAMSDINELIRDASAFTGTRMDEVSGGFAFGAQAGLRLSPTIGIFGAYERLLGGTDLGGPGYRFELQLPADAVLVGAQYALPLGTAVFLGFSGALGIVTVDGRERLEAIGQAPYECRLSGSDVLFQGRLFSDFYVADRVIFSPSVGYRKAKIEEFEECEETVRGPDGAKMELDYSGLLLRTAVKVILN